MVLNDNTNSFGYKASRVVCFVLDVSFVLSDASFFRTMFLVIGGRSLPVAYLHVFFTWHDRNVTLDHGYILDLCIAK